ncbi:flagellar biosynthesis protein FlhA [Natranaerofaba carboxydovora]|uniref:flagellar biosynthesis protein FlhA n=1 Tax=Natranaerofaba carboxydovora TaxID=2742683 RepID=UPI001F12EF11|nr:flagellar biosynthesis protein FlhA [Natranaerofaba carboxydovora]UMZ73379.1 Flagellar biosynthesis protein FlhA [Natranaerofaba carboxydovora]
MKHSDLIVIVAVIATVFMLILPVPAGLLDFLLVINITIALTVLLVSMYTFEPLQFSILPSLLLLTTLYRLALNVSSTRLILLDAHAGEVIAQFGNFVVGGNPVVGFIVFLILVVIQFIVITKGAERVSEVTARFVLDAMPGKQMAIDADLNSGLITEDEARERRQTIQKEADFYGAMDGATKFVKGDAIAAIVIIVINITGGFAIGMIQMDMSFADALSTYILLSVGDGLVSQIPALLISTAAGIVVTRAASDSNLGVDVLNQILAQPKALFLVSGFLLIIGFLPGLPPLPFIALGSMMGFIGYQLKTATEEGITKEEELEEEKQKAEEVEEYRKPENVMSMLQVDPIEFEIGYGLLPLADPDQGGDFLDRVTMIRRQVALDLGLIVPEIRVRDNIQLAPNEYVIKIKGIEIARSEVYPNYYLVMNPEDSGTDLEGIDTTEPVFGLPAKWIEEDRKEQAEMEGLTIVDPPSVLATHLTEVIKQHAHELLGRQEVQSLLDNVKEKFPTVVEELVGDILSVGEIRKVLANLLREGVSIRNLVTILEALTDYASITKDTDALTEYVRQSLSRQISNDLKELQGHPLKVVTLSPDLEKAISDSIQSTDTGNYLSLDPKITQNIQKQLKEYFDEFSNQGIQPIIVTSPMVRLFFKRLTESFIPGLLVVSYNELESDLEIQSVGVVKV